jgi:YVTN family beta-propeller protein
VAVIDPTTNRAEAAAELADDPTAITADATAAWVTHFAAGTVSRVDAADHGVSSIEVGNGPRAVAAADLEEGALVWVANTTDETLSEIDSEQPDQPPGPSALLFRPGDMAHGDGVLWIIDALRESVVPVDAASRAVGDPIAVDAGPEFVAAGGGAAWVSNAIGRSLSRIPIGLSGADAPIGLDFTPGALALDVETDALWIVDSDGDAVVRLNIRTRQEESRIVVGARPVAVAVGAGAVWIANAGSGTVSRIDPATNTLVATITIGGALQDVAVSGTTVWVAVAEP